MKNPTHILARVQMQEKAEAALREVKQLQHAELKDEIRELNRLRRAVRSKAAQVHRLKMKIKNGTDPKLRAASRALEKIMSAQNYSEYLRDFDNEMKALGIEGTWLAPMNIQR